VRGDLRLVVEYDQRYFAFEHAEAMATFLRTPWKFHSLPTPVLPAAASLPPLKKYNCFLIHKSCDPDRWSRAERRPKIICSAQ
jgi:hypothetical protein